MTTSVKNPKPPESKHKKTSRQKNRKTWFDERCGCAWPSKKLPRGDHAEVTPIPPPTNEVLKWFKILKFQNLVLSVADSGVIERIL